MRNLKQKQADIQPEPPSSIPASSREASQDTVFLLRFNRSKDPITLSGIVLRELVSLFLRTMRRQIAAIRPTESRGVITPGKILPVDYGPDLVHVPAGTGLFLSQIF